MNFQYYIGIMSGTSMDGADAVLIKMNGNRWVAALAHAFEPYSDELRGMLLALQDAGNDELHRSKILARELTELYVRVCHKLLNKNGLLPHQITAIGCHGQTVRHAPEYGYSIQLADWALLAEQIGVMTIGDFRSRDLAAGGQGAPLVPAFHQALFAVSDETRVVLNIGGIANISILTPLQNAFGFDTGPGNMLMDAWVRHVWGEPYDRNGTKSREGNVLPELLNTLCTHPYFVQPYPKSTGRELFSLSWLQSHLSGSENPNDVLRTLLQFTVDTIIGGVVQAAPDARNIYVCGGGIANGALMTQLQQAFKQYGMTWHSTAELKLDPQWVEAAAFAWLAACWVQKIPSNPYGATGAIGARILGAAYCA